MKVLFDHQIFSIQKYGGVSRYFFELINHLPKNEWDLSLLFSNNEYIKENGLISHHQFFPNQKIIGKASMICAINNVSTVSKLIQGEFDVFHQTHFHTYSFPFLKNKPLVTTFHDMNFSRFNHPDLKIQKKSVAKADKIIAVSKNTKNELINLWNIPEERIEVVYHGVDIPLNINKVGNRLINEPYILYVGLRVEFKNFRRFASAYSLVKEKHPYLKLICTGSPFTNEEKKFLNDLKILEDTISINATEEIMSNLYTFAELFVYPSLYEGFGMPILEAMSYGCPTLISNASCFPEIAGNASFYFDPYDVDSIISSMLELLDDNTKRKSKSSIGYALCKKFTWERSAQGHRSVYKSLL